MRKQVFKGMVYSFLFIFLVTSCVKKESKIEENQIAFDSIRITAVEHLFGDTTKPNCNVDLKYTFPSEYKNENVLATLQKQFNKIFLGEKYEDFSPVEAGEKFKTDYLNEYKNVEKEFIADQKRNEEEEVAPAAWYSYYLIGDVTIHFNKGDILSTVFYTESYYGGAHGEKVYAYEVFNLNTGLPLKEKDIFVEGYEKELNTLILDNIAEQNEVGSAEELIELGYFGALELTSNDNFIIDEHGLTYVYNEYEIAPYVLGATQVFIPYSKLKLILKQNSPVSKFYN
ncbi:MAG: DUF3298 and DUF4163 domain-containing protein [Candidatus Azobacteroides sp.]|nr:DUF3298 and DUF4163 domain-containing protein [Candidatus Azobacteroides sp.]